MPSANNTEPFIRLHAITDVGQYRSHNEDNFIACPDLGEKRWFIEDEPIPLSDKGCILVVADGMGGTNAGEVASKIAVDTVQKTFNELVLEGEIDDEQAVAILKQAILDAHRAIVGSSIENPGYSGMGTTIVVGWVLPGKAHFGWCGDSRAYLYRKGQGLKRLTNDHSLVWEWVEAGKITPDEADVHPRNNIITQSLGDQRHSPQPEFSTYEIEVGDRLLLCSDGLNNMVNHSTIESILETGTTLAKANKQLVKTANANGGEDNTTILSLEVIKNKSEKKSIGSWLGLWFLSLSVLAFFIYYWL